MMPSVSALALFCDDLRQEIGNKDSIMGIFPDNLEASKVPGALMRLAVYIRIHIAPQFEFAPMSLRLVNPDDSEIDLGEIEQDLIRRTIATVRERGPSSIAGMISRAVMAPFPIDREGAIRVMLRVGDE